MHFRDFSGIDGLDVLQDVELAPLTTFRIGGRARVFLRPLRVSALESVLSCIQDMGLDFKVLGRGSNILIDDRGVDVVLSLAGLVDITGTSAFGGECSILTAGAGCSLGALISWAAHRGLSGLEGLCGIPGSVGGAVRMNAGVLSEDIGSVLHSVCFTGPGGSCWISREGLEFGYRSFNIPDKSVVSAVRLCLVPRGRPDIFADIKSAMKKKRSTQPLGKFSAGCIFKNPSGISAGKLIDMCGLKGFTYGDAQVSCIHANFIVNNGNASFADVMGLMNIVKDSVGSTTGIELMPEIAIWGAEQ